MLAEWFEADERKIFLVGLARLDELARAKGASAFAAAGEAQQLEILGALEQEALGEAPGASFITGFRLPTAAPRVFFRTLKELVLVGYYTSQIGATQELHWNPVPGRFEPCVHAAPAEKTGG